MSENRGFDFLDYLILLTKWRTFFISLTLFLLITSYISIYFLIPAQYDSRSLLVASENDQAGGIASLMKSFSNLPISIPGIKKGADTDIFTTIIFSRTTLEEIVHKFGLFQEYGCETMEETISALSDDIKAEETKESAYEIIVRNKSPQKAADMVNYIVEILNKSLIDLNISKSRDNRLFLEKRYDEINSKLKLAEESLVIYQKKSGILSADIQAKTSFETYSKLEADLAVKQIEYSILSKLYGDNSPQSTTAKVSLDEYEKKINQIKNGEANSGLILALKNLPQNSMNYLRYFRDVQIYNKMLEFIIPLYEQSRFEEQKNIPVLKVIDKGIPALKRAFPKRGLLSVIFTFIILSIVFFVIILIERISNSNNPKIIFIKQNLFFKKKV